MDYKCWCCPAEAIWICDCPQDSRSCTLHYGNHKIKYRKCNADCIIEEIREVDNALTGLRLECTKLAQDMMIEIEKCYKENLNYLCLKKYEAKNLIYRKAKVDHIKDWARTLNLPGRDRDIIQFIFTVRKLLGIDNASSEIVNIVEKLKKDCNEQNKALQYQLKVWDEKYKAEENKIKLGIVEFMGKINKENYQRSNFERIKYKMLELNFDGFMESFIDDDYKSIVQISHTNDQKFLFVCKLLSRL